jgi:hypothetical protein
MINKEPTENFARKTVGNESARPGKRAAFEDSKAERSNLADSIAKAYAARTEPPFYNPRLEPVAAEVKPKRFKK